MKEKSKSFHRGLISSTALVAVALLAVSDPAYAGTVTINTTGNSTQTLIAADDLVVTGTGSITDDPGVDVSGGVAASSISNDGTISASTTAITINTGGSLTGDLTNTGTISSSLTTTTDATMYGIYMDSGSIGGALSNSGTISSTLTGSTSGDLDFEAYGLYAANGSTIGSISNSGTISSVAIATSTSSTDTVSAYGIYLNNSDVTGALTNSGTISGTGTASGNYAYAYVTGIWATNGSTIGSLTNTSTGVISGTGTAIGGTSSATATAAGLYFDGGSSISGALTNAGTISGTATAHTDSDSDAVATAYGIYLGNTSTIGNVVNSGTISGTAMADSTSYDAEGYGYGIYANSSSTIGNLTNTSSGTISGTTTVNATMSSASASAFGIYLSNSSAITGAVNNAGTISGMATANSGTDYNAEAYAYGIYMRNTSTIDSLTNTSTGTISATATADSTTESATAQVYGVYLDNSTITNALTNAGTVSGTATARTDTDSDANATAYGLYLAGGSTIGSVSNTGTIAMTAIADSTTNDATATAYGIYLTGAGSDVTGGITNSGTISGSASATATSDTATAKGYGIYLAAGADLTGGLTNTGTISGSGTAADSSTGIGIFVTASQITGGITNTGTISGSGGTAISLNGLTGATPLNLNGGSIVGDVIDDTPGNGFSVVSVGGDFATSGDFDVSDLIVTAGNELTVSSGDAFQINDMSTSAGTLGFGVGEAGGAGLLTVTAGDVDLTGATISAAITGNTLSDGDEFLIADGTAMITGGPGATLTDVIDNSFLWSFQIADGTAATAATDNTDLFLFATQDSTISDGAMTEATSNIGGILDGLSGSGNTEIQQIVLSMNTAPTQGALNENLEAVMPTIDGGATETSIAVATTTVELANDRLASLRTGDETGMAAGDLTEGLHIWAQGFGQTADQGRRDNVDGYEADTYGVSIGVDTENIHEDAVIGLALSYANTEVDSKNANTTETEIDTYQAAVYGNFDLDNRTYATAMLTYAWGDIDSTRHDVGGVSGLTAHSDTNSSQVSAHAELGRSYSHGEVTVTPYVEGSLTYYEADDYTETGAGGANLNVDNEGMNKAELGVGARASWDIQNANGSHTKPTLSLGYRYDFVGDNIQSTSNFVGGGGSFDSQGPDPAQGTLDARGRITYHRTDNWEFTADYHFEYKQDYTAHAAFLRTGYRF
jgi:outer membrane autotransporter protein